ncbi:helix-turn-helix domain-containing protein [Bacillus massilinigeriensis]|uniref:helix-turn-helix domain-containing protein n=1 Tax=Bacillus mediterraneensis TaxID=1805474 RepID=UPI0008F9107C|nr:helix-turn-helix transcriptional regulator [Bacillus mediterraneensis]
MSELNIAATLVSKRKEKGVTQEALANYIGVSKASVSKWETGHSYPDIVFLPQLAAYFNISVDELINYQPQMIKEDIRKLYIRLSKEFTEKSFDDMMKEIRETIRKYYSCFPLLFQMGALIVNHHTLAEETNRPSLIREAMEIFLRVKSESNDFKLCKQANLMEAACSYFLSDGAKIIELLEDSNSPMLNECNLLSMGYAMDNQQDKANEILQVGVYQNLLSILQNLLSLLQLEGADAEKANTIIARITSIADEFEVEKLHPSTMLAIYLTMAGIFVMQDDTEKALSALQKYCDLAVGSIFPIILHGDSFFDKIDGWLSELDLGVEAPRNDKTIKRSIVESVTNNPAFAALSDHRKYKNIVGKLSAVLGG